MEFSILRSWPSAQVQDRKDLRARDCRTAERASTARPVVQAEGLRSVCITALPDTGKDGAGFSAGEEQCPEVHRHDMLADPRTGTWWFMMEQVSATRSELLARRARIGLAVQGRDLLKERRSALINEFNRLGASVLESMDLLERDVATAGRSLGVASAADGREPLTSAALAAERQVEVSVRTRSVAGVPIVEISKGRIARARTSRGYSLVATSARIDAVAERFEAVLERLLEFAALELSVRRLADEIARTTRRMNALEHVVLPRLDAERVHISLVLEERELEDRVRLRRSRARGRREGTRR